MKRFAWVLLAMAVLVAGGIGFVVLDPDARLLGWVGGEPFFQGRSATAWRHDLLQADEVKRTVSREALTQGKAEAVPVCAWILDRAPEPDARSRAADAIKQMGKEGEPAGEALLKALDDPDAIVRGVAAQAVEALAPDLPSDAVPQLIAHFPQIECIRAIAKFGPAGKEAIPRLVELLKNANAKVRFQAVRALSKIGADSLPEVPTFIRMMAEDADDKVREISAEAIGALGPAAAAAHPDSIPALAKALKDPAWNVRRDAVRSLGQLGAAAKPVLAQVKALEKDEDDRVKKAAARAAQALEKK